MPKSPSTAPSKCAMSSIDAHPPKADTWPLVSSGAYQRVPSPRSPDRAGAYASGRMPSCPTSTQVDPQTHPTEAINGIMELGTRTARGYRNPSNYQLLKLLITPGLDISLPPTYDELQAHATSFIFRHYLAAVLNRAHDNYKQQLPLITVRSTGNPGRETADTSGQPIM